MIGYYIHHHGRGHLNRAISICALLRQPVTALTSLDVPLPHPFIDVLALPRDDDAPLVPEPTAHGALHWAPHHHDGLTQRMALIARWITDVRPAAMVVDVSVEVATFTRLLGVPVIVMALPGARTDAPHRLVHRLADHIVAAWPRDLYEPAWLRPYVGKTSYVGGISRFEGASLRDGSSATTTRPTVLVLGGAGGCDFDDATVDACASEVPNTNWTTLGLTGGTWAFDPWSDICTADVVVTHAGQGCVADIAAARRPAVILPQPRPFGEQHATAEALRRHRLAVVVHGWPKPGAWPEVIATARAGDPEQWSRWQTDGAAIRAAEAIAKAAGRHATRSRA